MIFPNRLAGTLPPAEPLVLWIGEQAQVHLFGGSPTAVTFQFWLNVLSSVIQGHYSTHFIKKFLFFIQNFSRLWHLEFLNGIFHAI